MIKVNGREIEFETFPNGETRMKKECFHNLLFQGKLNQILFKYTNDSDLVKLEFVKKYIDLYALTGNALLITHMPYARMDRSENDSPFTLKYASDIINRLDFQRVDIIEPHSDVTAALVNRSNAIYVNFDLVENVMDEVEFDVEIDYLVFPDAGAQKRYSKMKAKNVLIGHKVRDFETGEIKGLDLVGEKTGDGKTAIIVDDLSSYGGTFVHTAKRLREEGFEKVYLLVAHAENSIFKGVLFDNVDKVFTTNSMITEQDLPEHAKFQPQLKIYDIEEIV